jgi:regulatory protein
VIVEGLVPDPRRPGSTRIVVNGRPAWTVPADVIAGLRLDVGAPLKGDVVERLDRAADEEGAFRAALRALERRAHGERELANKLERRGHTGDAIAAAAERLRALGLLDDLVFARAYIAGRTGRGRGPIRLRHDLHRLGVAKEMAEQALAELLAGIVDPLERPRALVAKRARQMAGLSTEARRRRLLAFLGRRGYQGSDARSLIEEALKAS